MKEIMDIAKSNDLIVIEDCAEALGSFYEDRHVGTYGDVEHLASLEIRQLLQVKVV